jgi:spore germination cell wall hydrolase CwlJ-like protein
VNHADYGMAALTAWREARDQGPAGMAAVLHVMANRSATWGKTPYQVVTQPNQFSSMTVRGDVNSVLWPCPTDMASMLAMAQTVLDGGEDDPTQGALYYANLDLTTSKWFTENIVGQPKWHPVTVKIGKHTFFK